MGDAVSPAAWHRAGAAPAIVPLPAAIFFISSNIATRRIGFLIATAMELACPLVTL
jgi:hypothetical protein